MDVSSCFSVGTGIKTTSVYEAKLPLFVVQDSQGVVGHLEVVYPSLAIEKEKIFLIVS